MEIHGIHGILQIVNDERHQSFLLQLEAQQLSRLILNLLDLSKGDEGKLAVKRRDVDLEALVGAVLDDFKAAAEARRLGLSMSVTRKHARLDEDLLRRILANLIENALRHAPPGTAVSVRAAPHAAGVEFQIVDAGQGVAPELRDRIFDPFMQIAGSELRPSRSGRGLGLAFCKVAVEAHGGKIWVADASPGAAFNLVIPDEG